MEEINIKALLDELEDLRAKYEALKTTCINLNELKNDTEKKLIDIEARNAALLSANPDLMFVFDQQGCFIDYSGGPNEMYAPPHVFIGKRVEEVLPNDVAKLTHEKIKLLFETGKMQVYDYELVIYAPQHKMCKKQNRIALIDR